MSLAYTFREILTKLHVADIEKFNPYHGPDGRFTTGSGATSFTIRTKDPGKQHMVGQAVVAEAANQIRNLDHEESRIITPEGRMIHFTSGGEHEVAMTVGEKREYAPGAIVMHNHPSGGTFSPDDLHDLGYRPKEMRAVAPEGDYVMRAADPNVTPHWPKLRDAILEAENSQFKSQIRLKNEIYEQKYKPEYEKTVGLIADKWVEEKKSGAPQETLDATFKQWEAADAAWQKAHPKAEREAEAERAYLDQYHNFYREHAAEHGIVYEFEPQVKKFNQNHDPATGRFTTGNGGGDLSKYGAMIRKDPPPKKTIKAYKAFIVKDGKLYPPMVANPSAMDTPQGVWLDAQEGQRAGESKTGRPQVKAGGKGTKGGSGQLAYRPGWHLGDIPLATQFFTRNKETGEKEMYPNLVFAECEIAADHDYQDEAMSYGYTESGKFRHSYAGLPKIPKDGYYTYRTNPDPTTRPWYITGAMKVGKILTDKEADKIIRDSGNTPMKRKDGPLTKEKLDALMSGKVKKGRNPNGCGVLVVQDGKVLVGTRIDSESKGQICGPGGHVESGEPTIEAARREAFEEFGIVCHDLKRLDRQDGGRDYGKSDVFLCTKFSGTPTTDEEEMTEPRWADPGELTDNLFPPFEQSLKLLPNIKKYNHNHDPATGRFASGTKAGRDKSYQITHRPPTRSEVDDEEASYAYDIDLMMPGFYEDHRSYTGLYHDGSEEESISALLDIHGNPEAEVTVYRGSPKNELNDGDWVSLSRKYAEQYAGDGAYSSEGAKVHAFKVKAKDLTFDGNSINEFGFRPADGVEKSQTFWQVLLRKFNHNHDPATGRFTTGSGGASSEVKKPTAHELWNRATDLYRTKGPNSKEYQVALDEYWKVASQEMREHDEAERKRVASDPNYLEEYTRQASQSEDGGYSRAVLDEGMLAMAKEMGQRPMPKDDARLMINHFGENHETYGYFYSSNSRKINEALRKNPEDDPFRGLRPEDVETIKAIDRHMAPSTKTVWLARMMSGISGDLSVGSVIVNKGYSSTSYDLSENKWTGSPIQLHIRAPKGTKMLMSPVEGDFNGAPEHAEVLLARGTAMKITSVNDSDGATKIYCEVVID